MKKKADKIYSCKQIVSTKATLINIYQLKIIKIKTHFIIFLSSTVVNTNKNKHTFFVVISFEMVKHKKIVYIEYTHIIHYIFVIIALALDIDFDNYFGFSSVQFVKFLIL